MYRPRIAGLRQLFVLILVLVAPAPPSRSAPTTDDPPQLAPDASAETGIVYASNSEGGLRYTWLLPEDYDPEAACDVTVILHGTGLDYRWGHWNHPTGVFRPQDIVLSVDGTSPNGESRLFLGEKDDAKAFDEFLKEMRELFDIDQLFLYGHSQGGFFAIYFAGEYPEAIDGAVAHASGAWSWSKMSGGVKEVPLAFVHGTRDPVVPYRQSPASRDAYSDKGFELLHLRRMQGYNHWPNAVRVNEVIGWCDGMSTDDPAEALAEALEILRKKPADQYQYTTTVDYSGARDVLRRLVGEGHEPFDEVEGKLERQASKWIKAIEKEGATHVSALRRHISKKKDLKLESAPWLGHLLAVREDFRGVDSVEAYVDKLGFDKAFDKQAKSRAKIIEALYSEGSSQSKYETIVPELDKAFLFEGYPLDFVERLDALNGKAKQGKFSKKAVKSYPKVAEWQESMDEGYKQYADIWKKWDGPEL